jgi:hypothetical protein
MPEWKIACPKCEWEPLSSDRWQCTCGHVWNTFDTVGRCPACHMQWEETQCLNGSGGCAKWSPHLDWYRGLDDLLRRELERIFRRETVKVTVPAERRHVHRS